MRKQPQRTLEELKKKLTLKAHNKVLCEFQDHSLRPLLRTILHLSMQSMEELPSSHAEAIEDLEEMQLLAAPLLCTPSVHSQTSVRLAARSRSTLSASRSTRLVHHCHHSLTVIVACLKLLSSSAHGSAKCFPRQSLVVVTSLMLACLRSALLHSSRRHHHNSSRSTPPLMPQQLRLAHLSHMPLAHLHWLARVGC